MKKYLSCMRIPHYVKNLIIFLPAFFNMSFFKSEIMIRSLVGFLGFCFLSSGIYIFNDINDVERDKEHVSKKKRPIAAGAVSVRQAYLLSVLLSIMSFCFFALESQISTLIWPFLYLGINILYSSWGKNVPIIDVVMLSTGYLVRLMYGGAVCNIEISMWLFLTVISLSFYFALGKRRGEYAALSNNSRPVLHSYSFIWLNGELYMMQGLSILFYALWSIEKSEIMVYTVPLVLIICMYYDHLIITKTDGDPIETLMKNKMLIFLAIMYCLITFGVLYYNQVLFWIKG